LSNHRLADRLFPESKLSKSSNKARWFPKIGHSAKDSFLHPLRKRQIACLMQWHIVCFHFTDELESFDANMIVSFKKTAGRKMCVAYAAFTLIELMITLGIFVLVTSGIIYGYVQSNRFAEWSAMSLAAQAYAAQGVEQARSATWSISTSGTGVGTGDELTAPTRYSQINTMQIPISGQTFNVTNWISVSNVTTVAYPLRQIRADCYWKFPLTGKWFTNTVITERAPDQ
jgi:type II secretory pathway pseudopilin PulG